MFLFFFAQPPPTLKDFYPNHFREKQFSKRAKMYRWYRSAVNVACRLGEQFGHNTENFAKVYESLMDIVKPSLEHRNVLCHNDLTIDNIMFSESRESAILLDFQMIRYVPPAMDILQLLHYHTSREFRKVYERELVKIYHSILVATVNRTEQKYNADVPSLNDMYESIKDLRLFGVGIASLYLPMALIKPDVVKDLLIDDEAFEMFLFGDRVDVTKISMQDFDYKERIKDAIDDFADFVKNCDL